jgi:hypothetical protein
MFFFGVVIHCDLSEKIRVHLGGASDVHILWMELDYQILVLILELEVNKRD